jgi:hypothetical protein
LFVIKKVKLEFKLLSSNLSHRGVGGGMSRGDCSIPGYPPEGRRWFYGEGDYRGRGLYDSLGFIFPFLSRVEILRFKTQ